MNCVDFVRRCPLRAHVPYWVKPDYALIEHSTADPALTRGRAFGTHSAATLMGRSGTARRTDILEW
jgi:hypothetical protein